MLENDEGVLPFIKELKNYGDVDIMIEAKQKAMALIRFREELDRVLI